MKRSSSKKGKRTRVKGKQTRVKAKRTRVNKNKSRKTKKRIMKGGNDNYPIYINFDGNYEGAINIKDSTITKDTNGYLSLPENVKKNINDIVINYINLKNKIKDNKINSNNITEIIIGKNSIYAYADASKINKEGPSYKLINAV
jgi:hypothetical protein